MTIRDLEPKLIWEQFDDITRVPRPSKKEEKIIEWLDAVVQEHGKSSCHADATVGTQRSTLGAYPFSIDACADRVVLEVELYVGVLLAYHIHV